MLTDVSGHTLLHYLSDLLLQVKCLVRLRVIRALVLLGGREIGRDLKLGTRVGDITLQEVRRSN